MDAAGHRDEEIGRETPVRVAAMESGLRSGTGSRSQDVLEFSLPWPFLLKPMSG